MPRGASLAIALSSRAMGNEIITCEYTLKTAEKRRRSSKSDKTLFKLTKHFRLDKKKKTPNEFVLTEVDGLKNRIFLFCSTMQRVYVRRVVPESNKLKSQTQQLSTMTTKRSNESETSKVNTQLIYMMTLEKKSKFVDYLFRCT